jgi:hypothetical protein
LKRTRRIFTVVLAAVLAGPILVACSGTIRLNQDWRTADRSSAGIAPNPGAHAEAIVQVYAARAFNWRGVFAVHTWIATKPRGADHYRVHHVVGWRLRSGRPVVVSEPDLPDRLWYGQPPEVLLDRRGPEAEALIPGILAAVESYPYTHEYVLWPGPNSNTFIAHIARAVPPLGLDLPPTAIGKDYLTNGGVVAGAPSGTGFQISLLGLLGVTLARIEGLEINALGVHIGLNPLRPSLRLPGLGVVSAGR